MTVTQQEVENRLWDAADELRVAMPEAQYSSVIFPLMFWKHLSDTWEHQHEVFLAENDGLLEELSAEEAHEIEYRDYQSFKIPLIHPGTVQERRASRASILATITQPGLGQRVRASLQAIETALGACGHPDPAVPRRLDAIGRPTDKLLVAHRHKNLTSDGPFRTEWTTACLGTSSASRTSGGPGWTFRRLRGQSAVHRRVGRDPGTAVRCRPGTHATGSGAGRQGPTASERTGTTCASVGSEPPLRSPPISSPTAATAAPRVGDHRPSTAPSTDSGMPSNAASTNSSSSGRWPPASTSSQCRIWPPSRSPQSVSGYEAATF